MTSLNGNIVKPAYGMSDLLQKHLQRSALTTQTPVYIPNSNTTSSWYTPDSNTVQDKNNKSKKAKIAAASLITTLVIAGTSVFGILITRKDGKGLVKKLVSKIARSVENQLSQMHQIDKNGKAGKILEKLYKMEETASEYGNSVENVVNGKDVLTRGIIAKIDPRNMDVENTGFVKKTYKTIMGKLIDIYNKFDAATTKIYKDKGLEKLTSLYENALNSTKQFDDNVIEALNKLKKTANLDDVIDCNGAQRRVGDIISDIENKITKKQELFKKSFAKEKVAERVEDFDNFLVNGENGVSLTEKTTNGFLEKIREKDFKGLLTDPIARGIIKDEKARRVASIRAAKDTLTNNLNTVLDANKEAFSGIRKLIQPSDIDSISKYNETIRLVDRYKRTSFKTANAAKEAKNKLFVKLDDLRNSLQAGNADDSAIKELDSFKASVNNIKPGETEDIMSALKAVLDNETYANTIEPACKNALKALHKACSMEMNDTMDKLRDINCGSAPTDFLTLITSAGGLLLYLAQADNNDERVSLGLTTGLPLISTVGTNLYGAINQFSGRKSMLFSLGTAFITTRICKKLDKAYKKSRGLDENAKPSVVTIDDYISYLDPAKNTVGNKFASMFGLADNKNNAQGS